MIEYDYDVFGKTYVKTESGDLVSIEEYNGELYDNSRLYTGREYDSEINLYFLRARYYDAELGRFISRDPIGQLDDVNLYAYVGNNSVMFVDLNGLEKTLIVGFKGGDNEPGYYDDDALANEKYHQSGIISLLNRINKENDENIEILALTSKAFVYNSKTITIAEEYILKNKDEYDKIVILGHSLGGDHSVVLSNRLNKHGIDVDLMVTIDIKSYYENDTVKPNVKKAVNYYQTNDFLLSGEDLEKSLFNKTSKVSNILYNKHDSKTVHHTDIDNYLEDTLYNLIK